MNHFQNKNHLKTVKKMSCFFLEFETKTWFAMNHLKQTMLALKTIEQWENTQPSAVLMPTSS
jgi:hypothetical protein